jgi:hypothetical protein
MLNAPFSIVVNKINEPKKNSNPALLSHRSDF